MKELLIFIVVVAVLGIALSLTVCKKINEDKKSCLIRTDIQEISWLLKPQHQPKAAWFTINRLGSKATPLALGPEDYRYSAVFLFDKQNIDQLLKQAKMEFLEFSPANEYFASLPELHLLLKEHGTLEGKVYDASGIVRNGGSMIRIQGTNKLFVTYTTR